MSASVVEVDLKGSCRVLVCGGRTFRRQTWLFEMLDQFHREQGISLIIEGGANGADADARTWAILRCIPYMEYQANWGQYGIAAGAIRNVLMLEDGKPDVVIAFPGGKGTDNMCKITKAAGVQLRDLRNG